jgi:hypothetical protein
MACWSYTRRHLVEHILLVALHIDRLCCCKLLTASHTFRLFLHTARSCSARPPRRPPRRRRRRRPSTTRSTPSSPPSAGLCTTPSGNVCVPSWWRMCWVVGFARVQSMVRCVLLSGRCTFNGTLPRAFYVSAFLKRNSSGVFCSVGDALLCQWTVVSPGCFTPICRYGQGTRDMAGPEGLTTEKFIDKVRVQSDCKFSVLCVLVCVRDTVQNVRACAERFPV